MIVVVTGANGFIGRHLVRDQLSRGRVVRAVDQTVARLEELKSMPGLELVKADVRDERGMEAVVAGTDVVFHLASAHLSVTISEKDYWDVNHDATRRLVRLSREAGVRRFVYCSSVGVYGEVQHPPADEESPCRPDLVYEKTKLAAEQAVMEYAGATRYPVVIVRPVWVYGPGCPRTEKLFRAIGSGRFVFAGDGRAMRHCIYIDDMLAAFELCANHPNAPGKVFIFGDHGAVPVRELVRNIADVIGAPPPKLSVPLWAFKPLCTVVERAFALFRLEPPLSKRSLKFFTNNTSFDIGKARRELGFEPRVALRDGLFATYEVLRRSRTTIRPDSRASA